MSPKKGCDLDSAEYHERLDPGTMNVPLNPHSLKYLAAVVDHALARRNDQAQKQGF